MRFLYIILVSFFFYCISGDASAQYLSFDLKSETVSHYKTGKEAKADEKTEKTTARVTLGPNVLAIRSEAEAQDKIYDFQSNTLTVIDHSERKYIKTSLYAVPTFKVYEKRNREMLSKATAAAGIDGLYDPFELEMMFGGDANGPLARKVQSQTDGGITSFSYDGEQVAAFELSGQKIPSELMDVYQKYFLYEHHLHPALIQKLTAGQQVFRSLRYRNKGGTPYLVERAFSVSGFSENARMDRDPPDDYQRFYAINGRLDHVIRQSLGRHEPTMASYGEDMATLLEAGKFLAASLKFHEYVVQYGVSGIEAITPTVQRIFKEAPPKSGVQELTALITAKPRSKAELQDIIRRVEDYRDRLDLNGSVVDVYLGNFYGVLDQKDKATDLILAALERNPFLTGAYKDLGDKFFQTFHMQTAWICWDRARELRPEYQGLSNITDLERQVRQNRPEYFQ